MEQNGQKTEYILGANKSKTAEIGSYFVINKNNLQLFLETLMLVLFPA